MIEFGDYIYYLDINAFEKAVATGADPDELITTSETKIIKDATGTIITTEEYTSTKARGKEVDGTKYNLLTTMVEILTDETEIDVDSTLGADRALEKTSLSYKIAFNTLLKYGVLKRKDA